jgi:hypothetical protein
MPSGNWEALAPNKTADAGGAVQCAFEKYAVTGDPSKVYTLVMSLPLMGVLRSGGVSFVLKVRVVMDCTVVCGAPQGCVFDLARRKAPEHYKLVARY